MTKSDLIDVLCETRKMPKGRAELLINVIFDTMEATLRRGERIEIRGFGSFEIRDYRAYEGRNPRTGATVNVKPKKLPFFKVGKELKERVNGATPPTNGARSASPAGSSSGSPPAGSNGVPEPSTPPSSGPLSSTGNGAASAPFDSEQPTSRSATA